MLALCAPAAADIPAPSYTIVNATTTTTIAARVFYGIGSTATQITAVSCFDNTALSGPQLYTGTPTASSVVGAGQSPSVGVTLASGSVTCAIAASVVAPGYIIYWGR